MFRKLAIVVILATGLHFTTPTASALELGMTPSNVFGLWTNINNCLLASAQVVSEDSAWQRQLSAMTPSRFEGKKPSDVLERVVEFRGKLNRLRKANGLDPTSEYATDDGEITPSVVFLNSGRVLNGLVDWIIRNSGPELLVSRFYSRNSFAGKTPSDVLGLVDLANRRLDSLLAKRDG